MAIKTYSYLTLAEVKEWLNIPVSTTTKDSQIERHINTACARVEKYIDAPVLTRSYTEYSDGNGSNVIMPSRYPIRSITEIKIDYNRDFEDALPMDGADYVLRGMPPLNQPILANAVLQVLGADIILRSDVTASLLGRLLSGSVLQSISMTYTAGLGEDANTIPEDIKTATLMLVEWMYMIKENREVGVTSKGVMGQSYSRKEVGESGMPMEIEGILNEYKDYALPPSSVPQKNI